MKRIKCGMPVLLKPLYKLFNIIFSNGAFPKSWDESIFTLIHKKVVSMTQVITEGYQ